MKALKIFLFITIPVLVAGGILWFGYPRFFQKLTPGIIQKEETVGPEMEVEPTSPSESSPARTHYTNQEFGFSLSYPADWGLPQENKITPPQQHQFHMDLNPTGKSYSVDIYDQPSPIPISSFVRAYFADVEGGVTGIEEIEINGQEAVKFFFPKGGLQPSGAGAIALRRGGLISIISTPVLLGTMEEILTDPELSLIAESFSWVEGWQP